MAKNGPKTKVFWPKIPFLDFPGRVLSNQGRGFPFGENPKNLKIPTQIPKYFGPFLTSWLDLVPARRSGWKKAARGCPRIQIWSHDGPNQSQNHVSGRSRYQPVGHFGRPCLEGPVWQVLSGRTMVLLIRQAGRPGQQADSNHAMCFGNRPFSFFPAKTRTLEKRHTKFSFFFSDFDDFFVKI